MGSRSRGLELGLELCHDSLRPSAAARAGLYLFAAEAVEAPPTWPRMREWASRPYFQRLLPETLAAPAGMAARALQKALTNEELHLSIWNEFERLLAPGGRQALGLFASDYAVPGLPGESREERCLWDTDKPCPFADWYCVDRQGAPCDHMAAALSLAARIWGDAASAQGRAERRRTASRCRSFVRQHLSRWTDQAADTLFQQAHTDFYQAVGLLIGTLIETESGAHAR